MIGSSTRIVPAMAGLAQVERRSPHPVFSELHILKGFESCVLKLRILQGLWACFAEVRMVKRLGCFALAGTAELGWNAGFQRRGRRVHGEEAEEWETGPACRDAGKFVERGLASEARDMVAGSVGLLSTHLLLASSTHSNASARIRMRVAEVAGPLGSWPGVNWFDTAVEKPGKVKGRKLHLQLVYSSLAGDSAGTTRLAVA